MQLFYNSKINSTTDQINFDKIESRHIVKVLRKKEGDILKITNGKGFLYDVKILVASDKKCVASVIKSIEKTKPWPYYLHVAIAPTKNNDRTEWFLEKATEIGIDEITPIICSNSERRVIKLERFEKIIQSAMKQSLKFTLPKLNSPIKFNDFIVQDIEGLKCIAHCEAQEKHLFKTVAKNPNKITILVGPEGDFSLAEIKKALENNYKAISLGESRLRTETAALVAVNTVSLAQM